MAALFEVYVGMSGNPIASASVIGRSPGLLVIRLRNSLVREPEALPCPLGGRATSKLGKAPWTAS